MNRPSWIVRLAMCVLVSLAALTHAADPKEIACWQVDEIRPGMKGHGVSVFKGSRLDRFEAEVLGVLKNTSPGRDLVLVRVAGCDLEKTGVIAGMSGSPVYIDGKLLGAVAYAWAFGKEPIAGVTPFCQMVEYAEAHEQKEVVRKVEARRRPLPRPIEVGGREFAAVTIAGTPNAGPLSPDSFCLAPLRTPLAASGFTEHSLSLLAERTGNGLVPAQTGRAASHVLDEEKHRPLQPGSPLAVALITGDFDLSGIGTVTHVQGNRVYGWGHPFMSLGNCELPLMSGYIHAVYPRQSVSFKMGSPIRTLGVIHADTSTGIAGSLGLEPDLMPLTMRVLRDEAREAKLFRCQVARHKTLLAQLVYAALTNSVDMEGDLPDELTAELEARLYFEDRPPVLIQDVYSGPSYAGGRAPAALFSHVAFLVSVLTNNSLESIRIDSIECRSRLRRGRTSAEIEAAELATEVLSPGETLKATVFLRPYHGARQRVTVELKLPLDLPEGNYSALICDEPTSARQDIRESAVLASPTGVEQVFQMLAAQTAARRTNLALRVGLADQGVALDGQVLPHLPASMVEMLANSKRIGAMTMTRSLVSRQSTDWVVQGSQTLRFTVSRNKRWSVD